MDVIGEFEETALMGCRAVREFLTYQGDNRTYLNRAKAGAVAMGAYARLRATRANERQIDLIEKRLEHLEVTSDAANVRALPQGV